MYTVTLVGTEIGILGVDSDIGGTEVGIPSAHSGSGGAGGWHS